MGRTNRSRKRKAQMDRIKKERNSKKELLRLKKTLGMLDEHGNELIKKLEDIVEYKTPEQLKKVSKIHFWIIFLFGEPIYLLFDLISFT